MKRRNFINISTGLLGLGLVGCGDDDGLMDSGPAMDAGPTTDGGPADDGAADDVAMASDSGPAMDAGPMDAGGADAADDAGPMDTGSAAMCVMVTFIMGEEHEQRPHSEGLSFPAADVIAGVPVTYDITGASRHPHTLEVTAEHFAALAAGESVTITSSFDSRHSHDVTLQCMS